MENSSLSLPSSSASSTAAAPPPGDFHKFHRPDAGSHTVEGNVSGGRAARLEQQRLKDAEEFERRKRETIKNSANSQLTIAGKFQTARIGSIAENSFRAKTVGLVSAADFKAAAKEKDKLGLPGDDGDDDDENSNDRDRTSSKLSQALDSKEQAKQQKRKRKERKKRAALLSFQSDELEGEEDEIVGGGGPGGDNGGGSNIDKNNNVNNDSSSSNSIDDKGNSMEQADQGSSSFRSNANVPVVPAVKKFKKDPNVDTSFLPDKDREQEEKTKRIRLEKEWKQRQLEIKQERLEITYSYWDGSGHRRTCHILKGSTVGDFLEVVRKDLAGQFRELGSVASDALLYVKEDLILPHDITFYDLIATKARGKSGPLFHFDVHDDVRVGPLDSRIEKDESHPGKVVERRWYERNKHIFPASRWEVYDPSKEYGTYTIGGGIVTKKKK